MKLDPKIMINRSLLYSYRTKYNQDYISTIRTNLRNMESKNNQVKAYALVPAGNLRNHCPGYKKSEYSTFEDPTVEQTSMTITSLDD